MQQLRLVEENTKEASELLKLCRERLQIFATEPPRDHAVDRCVAAWHELATCRPVGFGVGLIPFTAIVAWAEVEGMDRESTTLLRRVIRYVDNERAKVEAARASLERAQGGKKKRR